MLKDHDSSAIVAVADRARAFYSDRRQALWALAVYCVRMAQVRTRSSPDGDRRRALP
jgi:hypothetical protein